MADGNATAVDAATAEIPAEAEGAPSPVALLFAPDRGMARQAAAGRARWYFVFAWLASMLLGAALAYRIDARASTLQRLDKSEQLTSMSDRQVADETKSDERVFVVKTIAKRVVGPPFEFGMTCVALFAMSWFLRGRIKGSAVPPVAGAVLLPNALATLLDAASALRHAVVPPEGVPLSPRTVTDLLRLLGRAPHEPWFKLGNALDFFSLWSAVLFGFGLAAAAQLPKRRAITGALVAWVCYRLLTHVAAGGG